MKSENVEAAMKTTSCLAVILIPLLQKVTDLEEVDR